METVERYLRLLEAFETRPEAYAEILHPEIQQTEYPNAINPAVAERQWPEMQQGMVAGKQLLQGQQFRVCRHFERDQTLIVEAHWQGTVAQARPPFQAGQVLQAWFCMIFEFKEGLIWRQRNYDCFERF